MARDLKVGLTIAAKDAASDQLNRVSRDAERQAKRVSESSQRAARDASREQERANGRVEESQARLGRSREQTSIRTEARIRQEIQRTQAAYDRLARSGELSAREQGRAYEQTRNKIAGLRREMSGLEQQERRAGRGMNAGSMILRGGQMLMSGGLISGAAAGGYAIAQPIRRTASYERRLMNMSNIAFDERDKAGRVRGAGELKSVIDSTLQTSGGDRDQAANALETLLAAGVVNHGDALKLLPTIQKYSVAENADSEDVARLVNTMVKTGGVTVDQIPRALDMFVQGAKDGPIEFADLARGMPRIVAAASATGMKGMHDLPSLISIVENSMGTAGTPDEGMINVTDWLNDLISRSATHLASKVQWAPGKSVDLIGTLAADRAKGLNTAQSFDRIMNRIIQNDPNVKRVDAQLRQAPASERQNMLESQMALFEGSQIGKLLRNQQALRGYLSYRYMRPEDRQQSVQNIVNSSGAGARDWEAIATTSSFKLQNASNTAQSAEFDAFKNASGAVGDLAQKVADLAKEYPGMTKAAVGAAEALRALAFAAGSWMLFGALRGRGLAAAGMASAGIGVGEATAAGVAGAARGGSGVLRGLAKGLGPAAIAGIGGYDLYNIYNSNAPSDKKNVAAAGVAGGTGGSLAGMYAGAALGSAIVPVLGTAVGGALGAWGGNYLGGELAERLATTMYFAKQPTEPALPAPVMNPGDFQARLGGGTMGSIPVHVTVDVQNGNITASVMDAMSRDARRH